MAHATAHGRWIFLLTALAIVGAPLPASAAPQAAEPEKQDSEKPASPEEASTEDDPLPSLDELLGLEEDDAERAGERGAALPDPTETELDRQLSMAEAGERFREAVQLMAETAGRLSQAGDTGLATQRLQEDIIRKLDAVIDAAERNQQQSSSGSSSSRSSSSSQPQPSQPQPSGGQRNDAGENRGEAMPPGRQDGPLRPELPGDGASWGALPERVRDALLQGFSDRYSSMYERLTEAYYRRLAEEGER